MSSPSISSDKIRLAVEGHTAIVTIANPPANTWDQESLPALQSLVAQLNENADIYSLVITGQGDKFFSAGADLKLFADGDTGKARLLARLFGQAFETLSNFRGVSIAAVNGYAMGGGLECAMACDLRIAESHAKLALPEASVGLLPCAGGTQNLPWLVGEAWAKRMILLGERVDAGTAAKIGLVETVVDPGTSLATAIAWAKRVEQQSPPAVASCKKLIQAARTKPPAMALIDERELFVDLFHTEDQREGVNAFLEKRQPEWQNK